MDLGNELLAFSVQCLQEGRKCSPPAHGLLEHPEQLGSADRGEPASIWERSEVIALEEVGFIRGAIYQCQWHAGLDFPKPTGLLTSSPSIAAAPDFYAGQPELEDRQEQGRTRRKYVGPLPRECGHRHSTSLVGKDHTGAFRTGSSAAYPAEMCKRLADMMMHDLRADKPLNPQQEEVSDQQFFPKSGGHDDRAE